MWNLDKPKLSDSINDLSDICAHSRILEPSHLKPVEELYEQYDSQNGYISKGQHNTIDKRHAHALELAYPKTYKNRDHSNISEALKAGVDKCPMCSIGNASTLDHYMEKADFKALSIMRQNLVPMCFDCNHTRQTNKLKYTSMLHAYYDLLPTDRQWLKARLWFGGGSVAAEFFPDENVLGNPDLYRKASETIQGLELNETIRKEIPTFLTGIICSYKELLKSSVSDEVKITLLRGKLIEEADDMTTKEVFGLNHWKTVLLRALASESDLTIDKLKLYS